MLEVHLRCLDVRAPVGCCLTECNVFRIVAQSIFLHLSSCCNKRFYAENAKVVCATSRKSCSSNPQTINLPTHCMYAVWSWVYCRLRSETYCWNPQGGDICKVFAVYVDLPFTVIFAALKGCFKCHNSRDIPFPTQQSNQCRSQTCNSLTKHSVCCILESFD